MEKTWLFISVLFAFFLGALAAPCPLLRAPESAIKTGCYICVLHDDTSAEKFDETLQNAISYADGHKVYGSVQTVIKAFTLKLSAYSVARLQEFPEVKYIEEETVAVATKTSIPYHLDRVDQRELPLNNNFLPIGDGEGVDIYILDTGIFYEHKEFGNRAKFGGYDPVDEYKEENMEGRDCDGHGTHVASLAAGRNYGTASGANIYSIRALGCSSSAPWGVIIAGLDYAMRIIPVRGRPAVVSMSIGGSYTQSVNDAVQNLTHNGIPVVVSAGNDASDACLQSPASTPDAITVAGSADGDELYPGTNYGPCVDIFAPGHIVKGAYNRCRDCYITKSGTSMSTPIVSGAIAIMLQRQPKLTPDQIRHQLISFSTNDTLNFDIIPVDFNSSTPNRLLYIPGSCGGKIYMEVESIVTIESPNYPLGYFENIKCQWFITGPPDTYVRISFSSFSTESFHDTVELYDGDPCDPNTAQLATLSGQKEDLPYMKCDSLSNTLFVELDTDGTISNAGFKANIIATSIRENQTVVVGLEKSTYIVNEDAVGFEVCVVFSNLHTCCPVTEDFTLGFTVSPVNEYGTIEFGTCEERVCLSFPIKNNDLLEEDKSYILSLVDYTFDETIVIGIESASITVVDDDGVYVEFTESEYLVEEGFQARVCARLSSFNDDCPVSFPFSVVINTENGTAVSPDDYEAVSNWNVSFSPCSMEACIDITTRNDSLVEGDEEFYIELSSGPDLHRGIHIGRNFALVTIVDDDVARVRLQHQTYEVGESEGSVRVCAVVRSPHPVAADCPLDFSFGAGIVTSAGTAVVDSDYESQRIVLQFESCVEEVCGNIRIVDDSIMESLVEDFIVSLEPFRTDIRVTLSPQPSTVEIIDDDSVIIDMEQSSYRVREGGADVTACVRMVGQSSIYNTLYFSTVTGSAGSPSDFSPIFELLTFEPFSSRMCITIDIVDDAAVENTESFTVSLSRTGGLDSRVQLRQPTSTIEITDDDTGATVELVTGSSSVTEGHVVSFCAIVSTNGIGCAVGFDFSISLSFRGSAEATVDYGNIPMAYTVPACQNSTCVNVTIVDDDIVEKDETIEITGSVSDRRIRMTGGTKVITITDNDSAVVGLRSVFLMVRENVGQTTVCAVVEHRKSIAFPFDIKFTFIPRSATRPYDFTTGVVYDRYDPEQNEACVSLAIVDSVDVELPESLLVQIELREPNPVIRMSPDMSVGYIQIMDDDVAVIGLERTAYYLNSGSDDVQVCVYVSRPTSSCPISFPFDIIFRLSTEAADVFEVDETQTLSEGHGIERVDLQDSVLLYNSCQRKFCFDVSLKIETRPERGERFTISVERSPDHGRSIMLDSDKMSGFIQIR